MGSSRVRRAALLAVLVAATFAGCGDADGRVTLAFEPPVGTELRYRTDVTTTTSTDLPCRPQETRSDRTTLDARQLVLEPDGAAVRVEVRLTREGIGTRTFVMRFDRAAQLTAVEQVEGIPAEALGELGLSEIFPAAAGAPPPEPLAPGDRWTIDDEVLLEEGGEATHLRGEGRLLQLGVIDGNDTATVESETTLAVQTSASSATGTRSLDGEQRTEVRATYDLDTGALRRATAETTGTFRLELGPPPGGAGDPCEGTLTVTLASTVQRID